MDVFDLFAKISLDTSEYDSGLDGASKKFQDIGKSLSDTGSSLSKWVTAPVVGIGTAIVKTGADFEAGMSQVAATMGTTSDSIRDLRDFALDMGSTTSFSAVEAAEGLNILAQSGLDANDQMSSLPQVLDLAAAGNLSLANSATYVTGAVKGFSDSMDNSQYYTDLMAKGATLANTSVAGLGEALSGGAATAKNYGQTAEGTTLALLRLAEQNVVGSEAATALNRAMADLYTPTSNAKSLLSELGVATYDSAGNARDFNTVVDELSSALSGMSQEEANAYASTIFTTYGLQAFNKMTASSAEKVQEFRDGLNDAFGAAGQQAATQLDNLNGSMTILKSALEGLFISLSNFIIPAFTGIVQKATEVVQGFNSLDDGAKKLILTIAGIAAAVGPVLIVVGKVITAVSSIGSAIGSLIGVVKNVGTAVSGLFSILAANPMALVIAAVAALVAGLVVLWNTNEDFRNSVGAIWEAITGFFQNAVDAILAAWEGVKEFFAGVWESIKEAFSGALEFFDGIFQSAAEAVQVVWNGIVAFFSAVWEGIKAVFSTVAEVLGGFFQAAAEAVQAAWDAVVEFFWSVWEGIQAVFSVAAEVLGGFFSAAWEAIQSVWSGVAEFFRGVWESIRAVFEVVAEVLSGFFQAALDAIQSAWAGAVEFFSGVWSGIQGVFSTVAEVLGGFFKAAWEAVSGAWEAAKEFFSGIADGIREVFGAVTEFLGETFRAAWEAVQSAWEGAKEFFSGLWNAVRDAASAAAENIGSALKGAWDAVKSAWDSAKDFFGSVWDGIKGVFSDALSYFKDIGKNIMEGLWNGISDKVAWVKDKVGGVVNSIKNAFTGKEGFDEHSPSKWANQVFRYVMEGGVNGLDAGSDNLMREVDSIVGKVKSGMDFGTATVGVTAVGTNNYGNRSSGGENPPGGFGAVNNFNFTFNSPEALDPVSAAREAKKAAQQLAMGY